MLYTDSRIPPKYLLLWTKTKKKYARDIIINEKL